MIIPSFYNKSHGKIYNIINSKHLISYCLFIIRKIIVRFQNLQRVLFTTFSENNDIFLNLREFCRKFCTFGTILIWSEILIFLICCTVSLKYNFNFFFKKWLLDHQNPYNPIQAIHWSSFLGEDKNKAKCHTIMMERNKIAEKIFK